MSYNLNIGALKIKNNYIFENMDNYHNLYPFVILKMQILNIHDSVIRYL